MIERINKLTPFQRRAVDELISLFELSSSPADRTYDLEGDDLFDLYYKVLLNDDNLVEARHILQYAIATIAKILEQSPYKGEARAHMYAWQLCAAGLDMSYYFWTCDQSYRRGAIARFDELVRILDKLPQTYDVNRGLNHARTMVRRLQANPTYMHRDEPEEPSNATHLHGYWKPFDLGEGE